MLFVLGFSLTFLALGWPRWSALSEHVATMADAHVAHETAHPGWSFPARVWSAPQPLEGLSKERLRAHAQLRDYAIACPPIQPGEFCPETGDVLLRGGRFSEGVQPAGHTDWSRPLAFEPVRIGTLLGPDSEVRWHLPLSETPDHVIAAILAAEDEDYYDHAGVQPLAVLRAALSNARGQGVQQGASTLTMQVVRNLTQDKERSYRRKIREALSAVALDRHLGKEGVLQIYLDAPYLGQHGSASICGFQAASWHYFGVDARELSLAQAATLAAILPAPGRFAPDRNPEEALARRDMVLRRMASRGWFIDEALVEPLDATPHDLPIDRFPAYLQAVRLELEGALSPEVIYGAGLDVYTALDVAAQARTEVVLDARVDYLESAVSRRGDGPLQAAAALIDLESGMLVAAFGGDLEVATDFNRVTQARRQSGSAIKPLVYALAFSRKDENGAPAWTAFDTVPNEPRTFPDTDGWRPRNVGGQYSPTTTLAMGLTWSQNIATASLLEEVGGPTEMISLASDFGFQTDDWPEEMGLALGQGEVTPLEMARFVATVARGGELASARPVYAAIDAAGQLRHAPPAPGAVVLSPDAAHQTRDLMRLVVENGTGGASREAAGIPGYSGPSIGKTGTTDSEKDLWFVGSTASYAGALWMGFDKPSPIGASASDFAAPLWGWWMRAVHEGYDMTREFEPARLKARRICTETGRAGNQTCNLIDAPILPDAPGSGTCDIEHPLPEAADSDKPKYEGLWRRKAREEAEVEAAAQGGIPAR